MKRFMRMNHKKPEKKVKGIRKIQQCLIPAVGVRRGGRTRQNKNSANKTEENKLDIRTDKNNNNKSWRCCIYSPTEAGVLVSPRYFGG